MPMQSTVGTEIIEHFKAGDFERAITLAAQTGATVSRSDLDSILEHFNLELAAAQRANDFSTARRLRRRTQRLTAFCRGGFDLDALLPPVELPRGYRGKILLLSICGGIMGQRVVLRANDVCHRDILRNTLLELEDLGLYSTRAQELGGARLEWKPDGTISIWGSSAEFGACDKEFAARLVAKLYPEHRTVVED